jgi:hypothetical protein
MYLVYAGEKRKKWKNVLKVFFPLARSKPTLLPLQPKKSFFSSPKGEEVIQAFNKKKRKFKFWLSPQATVKG